MSPLTERLQAIRAENRPALIGYWPVGFPDVATSIRAMEVMVENGVDIIEVGVPYTDPVMDGATIQLAATQALANGVKIADTFAALKAVTAAGGLGIVMSYYNPIRQFGEHEFAQAVAAAGGVGVITPDITPDHGAAWITAAQTAQIDHIFLVAISSLTERLQLTAQASSGFVYAASVMGVTGARADLGAAAEDLVRRTRAAGAEFVCVGLGVSTAAQVAQVGSYADGVIIGSAFINTVLNAPDLESGLTRLGAKVRELAVAPRTQTPVW